MARIFAFFLVSLFLTLSSVTLSFATSFREVAPELQYQQAENICLAESQGLIEISGKVFSSATPIDFRIIDCAKSEKNWKESEHVQVLWPGKAQSRTQVKIAGVAPPPAVGTFLIISFSSSDSEDLYSLIDWRPQRVQRDSKERFYIKENLAPSRRRTSSQPTDEASSLQSSDRESWKDYKLKVQHSIERIKKEAESKDKIKK